MAIGHLRCIYGGSFTITRYKQARITRDKLEINNGKVSWEIATTSVYSVKRNLRKSLEFVTLELKAN